MTTQLSRLCLILIMINASSQIVAIAETRSCKAMLPLNCQPLLASKLKSDSLLASLRYYSTALSRCQVQPRNSFQSAVFLVLIASSASSSLFRCQSFLIGHKSNLSAISGGIGP
ncbi:uncharacterized protein K444DRAFT_370436 [Hyaloscypha bicolor E]|uniref:Secreted protein n=1 Tax=Hyaloscypha bicolor E TaxID=1095630 RepID=A0A2J6TEL6_9HELO|nr:uncharacterized protein K444DRAFT_370436 [Hyaloscypha bicolor E]PMD61439.1 hypothetical protein K444DRAFT_370436 [Hyaloscypha bicolor E]